MACSWSLTVEIVFYALVAMTGAYSSRRGPLVLAGVMAITAVSYVWFAHTWPGIDDERSKLTMLLKYFPVFVVGICAAVMFRRVGLREPVSVTSVILAGVIAAVATSGMWAYRYSFHLSTEMAGYERLAVLAMVGGFWLLIAVACWENRILATGGAAALLGWAVAGFKWIAAFGACTYPFYLLHDLFGKTVGELCGVKSVPVSLLFVAIVSVLIHRLVEVPLPRMVRWEWY